jgi:hypothetical protein
MRMLLMALATTLACASPSWAHPEHDMDMSENPRSIALSSAGDIVDRMVARGAIDASWRTVAPSDATLRQHNGASQWVVTFRNNAVRNPAQRVLYVVLSYTGDYISSSYAGQ